MKSDIAQCINFLQTALQVGAKDDRDREQRRISHDEKFEKGIIRHHSMYKGPSEPPIFNNPQYLANGGVILSWNGDNSPEDVDSYQLEIVHEKDSQTYTPTKPGNERKYMVEPFAFLPLEKYTVKVRSKGKNGIPPSGWSERIIVCVPQAPPNKPSMPPELITCFDSSTGSSDGAIDSVKLSVPYPSDEECNGKPLQKIMVYYSHKNCATVESKVSYNSSPITNGMKTIILKRLDLNLEYTFYTTWVNECGESEHSTTLIVNKNDVIPGPPTSVRESTKKTNKIVKLRWDKPEVNAFAVDHYEVYKMNKNGVFNPISGDKIYKCSATVRKLKQNTKYLFRVCSVNAKGKQSPFTQEIMIKTKLSDAVKGTLSVTGGIAGGVAAGFVSGPVGGVGVGVLAGTAAADKVNNKIGKALVGTLAGVGAGIPSVIGLTVLTPFTMVAAPIAVATGATAMVLDKDWSDQSSDEEQEEEEEDEKDNER